MSNEPIPTRADRGAAITRRMKRMGISERELAKETGISRATVNKAMNGDPSAQERKVLDIEAWLSDHEEEMDLDRDEQAGPEPVVFRMTTPDGFEFTVSGAPEEADMMREQLLKVIADLKAKNP